ncbi:surfactant protein C-like [Tiliqua scincoides]|uniref:surfactant protein C-like n=1 Tax=Tiliqua scincoides TaxID=71010 RepID=UPI0034629B94
MELDEKMDAITKDPSPRTILPAPPVDYHALDPEFGGCCPCCDCCDCCPSCGCCPNLCCCCPSCCCPPSCACCCRACCFLPSLLCKLPKFPSCPVHIKRLLIIVVVVVLIVVIIVGVLLMGLYVMQAHTETVLQMTLGGLGGGGESQLNLPIMDVMEETATFNVDDGTNPPATLVYNFNKLLIGYKSWPSQACYITRMDKGNIKGLDASLKEFQTKLSITPTLLPSLVDRSLLGTTINVLCSHVPVFWA